MRLLPQLCQKTKPCRFYARGMCTRGAACSYAHGDEELQSVPDLSRTKRCPALMNTGICQEPNCAFAHELDEIRRFPVDEKQGFMRAGGLLQHQRRAVKQEAGPRSEADTAWMPYYQSLPPPPSMMLPMPLPMLLPETRELLTSAMPMENKEAVEEPERSGRGPRNKFEKTKMCALFLSGHCKKRGRCSFAHSEEEMRPLPNLLQTKLCPKLLNSENCVDKDCAFAHSPEELRQWHKDNSVESPGNAPASPAEQEEEKEEDHEPQGETQDNDSDQEGWDSHDEFFSQSDVFSCGDMNSEFGWNRQQTEDPVALNVRQMRVKNTFITVIEEEEAGEKPRRGRARSAPAMMSDTNDRLQERPQAVPKPKETLPNAETFDFGAEGKPFPTSEDPSADSSSGEDFAMMHLQFGHRLIFPSPPQFFQVAESCDSAIPAPSLVTPPSLQHTASVSTQALALFKDCPLRINSGLSEWPPVQKIPDPAQDPQSFGEPHFVQPGCARKTSQAEPWPQSFPLDYGMNQNLLVDWRPQ